MSDSLRFGVIGRDISYSKSGDIFEAIFKQTNLDGQFELLSIEPKELPKCLDRIRKGELNGCSVTIPYKNEVIDLLDELDSSVDGIGAVNSISSSEGKLIGFNTDQFGFACPLLHSDQPLSLRRVMLLGCGGAARAVTAALNQQFGLEKLLVLGRSMKKLDEFQKAIASTQSNRTAMIVDLSSNDRKQLDERFDIVVNCTPLGGPNYPDQSPLPEWFEWESTSQYYDLSYNHDNRLVAEARKNGVKAFDGSAMLVAQALRSLKLWVGIDLEFEPIYRQVFGETTL